MDEPLLKPYAVKNLPPAAILCPALSVKKLLLEALAPRAWSERFIADSISISYCKDCTLCGPFLGAPAAAVITETLIASGVERIFLIGPCGGLAFDYPPVIGEIIFPRGALSEEGTTRLYGASDQEVEFIPSALQLSLENSLNGHRLTTGKIWTTDAPYCETAEKAEAFSALGARGVEMEFAAVAQLCHRHGIELAAGFVVSDIVGREPRTGFKTDELAAGARALALAAANCLVVT